MAGWGDMDEALAYAGGVLRGDLVRLREAREQDYAQVAEWSADPAVGILQTGWVRPEPAEASIERMRVLCANDGNDVGFVVEALDGATLLGRVGLRRVGKNRCAELAIVIDPPYWGNGYGSDASRVLVRYGFAEMGLHRIELDVFAFNTRAIATYAKLGFVEEGRRRQAIYHDGQWHDDVQMGLLADEWRQSAPAR
ncbi:MAG: GNAT family N-acetyltransferase [Nocardioidaceae bacterium]